MRSRPESRYSLTKKLAGCRQGLKKAKAETVPAIRAYCVTYWEKHIAAHEVTLAALNEEPVTALAMVAASAELKWQETIPAYESAMRG